MPRPTIYVKLANEFRASFHSMRAGWDIPAIPSLARQYGVARHTIRRALRLLEEQEIGRAHV